MGHFNFLFFAQEAPDGRRWAGGWGVGPVAPDLPPVPGTQHILRSGPPAPRKGLMVSLPREAPQGPWGGPRPGVVSAALWGQRG